MPFIRMPSAGNPEMVVSRCAGCCSFVGAARSKRVLSMVEAVHHCPGKGGRKPVTTGKSASEPLRNPTLQKLKTRQS
jgi:hypothetical protein